MSNLTKSFLLIFTVLVIDQISKVYVKTHMYIGERITVFSDWAYIHFTENNGMAFGIEFGGEAGKVFLSSFRIVAVILLTWYLVKLYKKGTPISIMISLSLIIAGAVGNIIDSLFYGIIFNDSYGQVATFMPEAGGYSSFLHGRVVDMLSFPLVEGYLPDWIPIVGGTYQTFFSPIFNVSDSSITIGVFIILIFQKRFMNILNEIDSKHKAANDQPLKQPASTDAPEVGI